MLPKLKHSLQCQSFSSATCYEVGNNQHCGNTWAVEVAQEVERWTTEQEVLGSSTHYHIAGEGPKMSPARRFLSLS